MTAQTTTFYPDAAADRAAKLAFAGLHSVIKQQKDSTGVMRQVDGRHERSRSWSRQS